MKRFACNFFLWVVPFALLIGVLMVISYRTELGIFLRDCTCSKNLMAAVVGDSRVEVHFDTREITWLRNFGLSGVPFPISLQKARLIAKLNPHLKMMVIDVWPHLFFSSISRPFCDSSPMAPADIVLMEMYTRRNMPPLGDDFHTRAVRNVLIPGLIHWLGFSNDRRSPIVGGFVENKKSIHDFDEAQRKEFSKCIGGKMELGKIPPDGEVLLRELISELKASGIKVVLTSTPMLWFDRRYSQDVIDYYRSTMTKICDDYNVAWHDWTYLYNDDMSLWADGCHLNDKGAKKLSQEQISALEKYLH